MMIPLSNPSDTTPPSASVIVAGISAPTMVPNGTIVVAQREADPYIEPKIDAFNWIFASLAVFVVGLRFFNRYQRRISFWWDDYIAFVSTASRTSTQARRGCQNQTELTLHLIDSAAGTGHHPDLRSAHRRRQAHHYS